MNEDRLTVIATKVCKEPGCGNKFNITQGEKEHFDKLGYALPERCAKCRLSRRIQSKKTIQIPIE